jgi:tRNA-specific 2-thiouridylase
VNDHKKKIFVGISGGVDSSVSAYLLKKEGYDVHGIFVKTWAPDWVPCTWVDEKRDAMRICAALDIPFHFLDATEEYKQGVADYMISEYKAGRTPNPDVLCNKIIKFGAMWKYAKDHGADGIATGHYAQSSNGMLQKGNDAAKDQSYFLWMIEKELVPQIMFPIGHLQKSDVRKIAEEAGLFTAAKKDSQGICFLGEVDMKDFLRHYIDIKSGAVVNEKGEIVGEHDGVLFYTLGERHGFRITEHSTDRAPYYIVGKDIENNVLIVSHSIKNDDNKNGEVMIKLRDTNWFVNPKMDAFSNNSYSAQIRYHGQLLPVSIIDKHTVKLTCDEAIPLGQSIVMYDGDTVLGGGVIDSLKS